MPAFYIEMYIKEKCGTKLDAINLKKIRNSIFLNLILIFIIITLSLRSIQRLNSSKGLNNIIDWRFAGYRKHGFIRS